MIQVYSSSRPGRPRLLLFLSAAGLAGMLALAWMQSRAARALGPEQAVPGTPLFVRLPYRWGPVPGTTDRFAPRSRARATVLDAEPDRSIEIRFERRPTFVRPDELLAQLKAAGVGVMSPTPARIGPFPGLQVLCERRQVTPRHVLVAETVLRLACLPRGEVIAVEYWPIATLTPADFELMDEVCRSVRLTDGAGTGDAAQLQRAAGLQLHLPAGWRAVPPDLDGVPGVYLQANADDAPRWVLGAWRTWLAAGRTPHQLLGDFAEHAWLTPRDLAKVESRKRPDGVEVFTLHHPRFDATAAALVAARLVVRSPQDAALVFTIAGRGDRTEADVAADKLADRLEFVETPELPDPKAAEAAGRELSAALTRAGPGEWWGREDHRLFLVGRLWTDPLARALEYGLRDDDAARGFEGRTILGQRDGELALERFRWTLDPKGVGYSLALNAHFETEAGRLQIDVEERRAADSDRVSRRVIRNKRRSNETFAVGPGYVSAPLEPLAERLAAASRDAGAWIVELSTHFGGTTHTRMYRALPPDAAGRRRLLALNDFSPRGEILAFDPTGELVYQELPGGRLEAVPESDARRIAPFLRSFSRQE